MMNLAGFKKIVDFIFGIKTNMSLSIFHFSFEQTSTISIKPMLV